MVDVTLKAANYSDIKNNDNKNGNEKTTKVIKTIGDRTLELEDKLNDL